MSLAEHHDHESDEMAEVDSDGDHADHGSTADQVEPDAEEGPKTPGWLTALGGALFLGAGVFWIASQPGSPTLDELTASAAPSASAAAPAEAAPAPPPPAPSAPPPIASAVASAKGAGKPPKALPKSAIPKNRVGGGK